MGPDLTRRVGADLAAPSIGVVETVDDGMEDCDAVGRGDEEFDDEELVSSAHAVPGMVRTAALIASAAATA